MSDQRNGRLLYECSGVLTYEIKVAHFLIVVALFTLVLPDAIIAVVA